MKPSCPTDQFVNDENKCVLKSTCTSKDTCNGEGGVYDESLENCFCDNVAVDPEFYCDAQCEY